MGILSTTSGTTGYGNLDGTSMAAPHVTGVAALVKALNPGYAFSDVDACLKNTALDLGAAGFDVDFGYGRVRADQVVNCGGGGPTPTVPGAPTLSATAGNGQVSLSWTTPSNGGSAITGYRLYRGTTSTSLGLLTTLGVTNSHVDGGLTNGQTYYYQVSAVNSVGEGPRSNTASAAPAAPPSGETRVYFEDMDDGAQGWTKSGSGDLWHTGSACVAPIGARHLAWTQDSTCTYSTGARVTNWAQSGAISLSGKTQATLKLKHQFDIEQYGGGAYDILRVQVSTDGVSWTTLQQWDSRNADVTTWTPLSYDVDGFTGGSLYLRLWTDTVDSLSNDYKGWFIEDVEVTAA